MSSASVRPDRFLVALVLPTLLVGCTDFRRGTEDHDGGGAVHNDADVVDDGSGQGDAAADAAKPAQDAGSDAGPTPTSYASAQAALAAIRQPGPLTAQGSTGQCTKSTFVWRDSDGALHSWRASDQARIDYSFKAPNRPFFRVSDTLMAVDTATFNAIEVYDATKPNLLVGTLPYAYGFAASSDGVIRLDQSINNVSLQGTKIRRWRKSDTTTEDVSTVLQSQQPASSFDRDVLVLPASVNVPYPLYLVDVAKKNTVSVTFDGAIGLNGTLATEVGLVVWYARSGSLQELRLYKNNQDTDRVEVGDEIANRPRLFSDSPPNEHQFIARMTVDGKTLIYSSAFGIFAYGLTTGKITALQLGPNKTTYVPDILCVIESARLLVYRVLGDSTGQIWTVPLASLLP